MARVRRVDRKCPSGDEDTTDLAQHACEGLVVEVFDEISRDGLIEGLVGERQDRDVRLDELEVGKKRPGLLDRTRFGVDADDARAGLREEVRERAGGAAEVENPVVGPRADELRERVEPQLRARLHSAACHS